MAKERSTWFYVSTGCAVLGIVGIGLAVAGGLWLFRSAKRFEAELKDPQKRTERVLEILHAERIPDGYHAMLGLSLGIKFAILSDRGPDANGEIKGFDDRGLIYTEIPLIGANEDELRAYFEGRTDDPSVLSDNNIHLDVEQILARGVISLDGWSLLYVAQRGSVSTHEVTAEGLTSVVMIDCPDDEKFRVAVWFGPDREPGADGELDLSGTPADEAAIAGFFAPFRVCD
jgi:hypothetical protein